MRMIRIIAACVAVLAVSGCTDWYYEIWGDNQWPHEQETLFTRLGGRPGIQQTVDSLTASLTSDPRTAPFFAQARTERFKLHLAEQFCVISGGPCVYTGYSMKDAHLEAKVTAEAYGAFLEDLDKTLAANGINADDREQFLGLLGTLQNDVVSTAP